jgi:hypothetical protein
MLAWIVRILFIMAAPIAALLVSRESLNFSLLQTMIAIILLVAFIGLAAALTARRPRAPSRGLKNLIQINSCPGSPSDIAQPFCEIGMLTASPLQSIAVCGAFLAFAAVR